jgi:hypothetical protein
MAAGDPGCRGLKRLALPPAPTLRTPQGVGTGGTTLPRRRQTRNSAGLPCSAARPPTCLPESPVPLVSALTALPPRPLPLLRGGSGCCSFRG